MTKIELTEFEKEAKELWGMALYKDPKGKWRYSDYPVSKDDEPRFTRYWVQIRKNKELHQPSLDNGKEVLITVEFIKQYWSADAIERKKHRERNGSPSIPVGIAVFFNQKRYNNYLIQNETEQKKEGKKCKCGQPVQGPGFKDCQTCLNYKDGKLKHYLGKRMNMYGELVDCYSQSPVKEMRSYFLLQDLNYEYFKSLKGIEAAKIILKLPLIIGNMHNSHVKAYKLHRLNP